MQFAGCERFSVWVCKRTMFFCLGYLQLAFPTFLFWHCDLDGVLEEELLELHVLQVDHVLVVVLRSLRMVPAPAGLQ